MPYFITTLHIAVEADSIEDARQVLADAELALEDIGCLTETAHLAGESRIIKEVPASFDPATDGLWKAFDAVWGDL